MAGRGRTLLGALRGRLPVPRHPPFPACAASAAVPDPGGHRERQVLVYSAEQMYELVANVGEYRLFVPWCSRSAVLSCCRQSSRSASRRSWSAMSPRSSWAPGGSGHLETLWQFGPGLPGRTDTCLLDFLVSFEFRSALHSRLASLFLDEVAKRMASAFEGRAQALFGPQAAAHPCLHRRAARRA